jgi:DNA invertase Pin-like site-specific DNA recombinase
VYRHRTARSDDVKATKGNAASACTLVAYYRVSTHKQGIAGLGMDAQQALVERYANDTGCSVVASYTEVESGKGKGTNRPELVKAMAHARRLKATLVIAKLDRLGRNVHFITGLMESGVSFVAADSPHDDRLILQVKAMMGEEELRKISERTKDALAALKSRGVVLGKPENLTDAARLRGAQSNRDEAITAYATIAPLVTSLRAAGQPYHAIAGRLNAEGRFTRTGVPWSATTIRRLILRCQAHV